MSEIDMKNADSVKDEEIIFKIKLKSVKLMAYGLIFFSIRRHGKECVFKQALASLKPTLFQDLPIELQWDLLKDKLFDFSIKKKDTVNQPITEDLLSAITDALQDSGFREDMLDYADREQFGSIYESLKTRFADVIPGRIEMQCELEKKKSSATEPQPKQNETTKQLQQKETDSKTPKFVAVNTIPDKLLGKKIGNLKQNDKVLVVIDDKSYPPKVYENLPTYKYGLHYGTFVEFFTDQNQMKYAILNLGNNFFGRFVVTKDNNSEKIKYVMAPNESRLNNMKFITDNTFTFYLIIISVAIILCFLSLWYYNWLFEI